MTGWFAMNRAMFDHPIFARKPDRIAAWAWMLATAAWKDTRQNAGGKVVIVKRGQLLTSFRQMSDATGVSIKALRTLLDRLTDGNAVVIDKGTGRMLITICNYDKYQASEPEGGTAKGTARARQGHTKEQENNKTNLPTEDATASSLVPSLTTTMWQVGKAYLSQHDVNNPGSVIGKWLKASNGSVTKVLTAIEAAQKAETHDPVPYITAQLGATSAPAFEFDLSKFKEA